MSRHRLTVVAFMLVISVGFLTRLHAAVEYTIIDMGVGIGWDVNDLGHAIGGGPSATPQHFFWNGVTRQFLPSFVNVSRGAINNDSVVAGAATVTGGGPGNQHAITWDNGTLTDLGTLGGGESRAPGVGPVNPDQRGPGSES